ncbi:MAG: hypothetical protein HY775_06405 [Acidobacteria bacterium]|nr:hypothetical protein [Acidobacteriota bacterium]
MHAKIAILLIALAGTLPPGSSVAEVPRGDGDPCAGWIGGFYLARGYSVPKIAPTFVIPIVDKDSGPLYLDVRDVMSDGDWEYDASLLNIWLYQETNGEPGLQRGGRSAYLPQFPGIPEDGMDPCWNPPHDTDVF